MMKKDALAVGHNSTRSGKLARWMGRFWLRLSGWKVQGTLPAEEKFILIAAPHTSNWDLVYMLTTAWVYELKVAWMGKHTLFNAPFGTMMRWLGGIPVNRSHPNGVVGQMVEKFKNSDKLALAIPPSGTRKKRDHWKSGFYHIAVQAQIPLCCGFLDYQKKTAGFGPSFIPCGNISKDMDRLRAFYRSVQGKFPEMTSVVCLKDETET